MYLAPGPPSSQSPSEARLHVSVQRICALVSPTILRADDQVKSKDQNPTSAPKPHMTPHSHVFRERRFHVHVNLPSRQDAQPQSLESVALVADTALPAS